MSKHTLNLAFIGAPSTGKTTLCKTLADKYETYFMPEYGKSYWQRHQQNRRLSMEQLEHIVEEHVIQEDALLTKADKILFSDTEALVTYLYAIDYFGKASERMEHYAQLSKSRYDHHFVCDIDIPYEESWERSGDVHRARFHQGLLTELERRKIEYTVLSGSLEERIRQVESKMEKLQVNQ